MSKDFSDPPHAAQPPDLAGGACACAAIKKQWLRDRRWFEAHPWRQLRARRMTPADCVEIRARGYRLHDIPLDRAYAVLIVSRSADLYVFRPASVTFEAAKRLDRMDQTEIFAREFGDPAHLFFGPVLACPPAQAFGFERDYKDTDSPPHWTIPCELRRRVKRPDLPRHDRRA